MSSTLPATFPLRQSYLKQVGPVQAPGRPPDLQGLPVQAQLQPDWSLFSEQPGTTDPWARVQTLLCLAAAPLRFEPHAAYNPHRAYPSPRALYSVHVVLQNAAGCWLFEANRHRLRGPGPFRMAGPMTLWLVAHPATVPAAYGALGLSLAGLEAGHLRGALRRLAGPLGLAVDSGEVEHGPPGPVGGPDWLPLDRLDLRLQRPDAAAARSAWTALQARSSGPGPNGLVADPGTLSADPVTAALAALPGPDADAPHGRYLLAQRLIGLDDGLYRATGSGPLQQLPPSAALAAHTLQDAYSYPASSAYIQGLNAVLLLTARYRPSRPFLHQQLALGEAAQRAALRLGEAGIFARPVRAYREAPLDALLNLGPDETVAYLLLCGRATFQDSTLSLLRRTP